MSQKIHGYIYVCIYISGAVRYFHRGTVHPDKWSSDPEAATTFPDTKPTRIPLQFRKLIFDAVKGFMPV